MLIVEDNALIAMEMADLVESLGCDVVGPAARVARALDLVEAELDCAVLDVNLGSERVWPVAEALADAGVSFVFATGYGELEVPPRFADYPMITKPVTVEDIRRGLAAAGILRK